MRDTPPQSRRPRAVLAPAEYVLPSIHAHIPTYTHPPPLPLPLRPLVDIDILKPDTGAVVLDRPHSHPPSAVESPESATPEGVLSPRGEPVSEGEEEDPRTKGQWRVMDTAEIEQHLLAYAEKD